MNWHQLHLDHLFDALTSSPEGLSSSQAQERLTQYGPNSLGAKAGPSLLQVFARQFANILIYILLAASLLALALGNYVDSFFVALVSKLYNLPTCLHTSPPPTFSTTPNAHIGLI